MKVITKQMIEDGLNQGLVKPVIEDGGLICKIGDYWFYFGGHEFENTDPSEIPLGILIDEIMTVLDAFREDSDVYEDEYLYYYYYLNENIH